ncbi:MAG: hypothetical protein AB1649_13055 [Chloroflexota bacterium]
MFRVETAPPVKLTLGGGAAYIALLQSLGQASFEEIKEVPDQREEVEPELGLSPGVVEKLQNRIAATQ